MGPMTSARAAYVLRDALENGVRIDRARPVSLSIALTKACIVSADNRVKDIVSHRSACILEYLSKNERIIVVFDENVKRAFTEGISALERISQLDEV